MTSAAIDLSLKALIKYLYFAFYFDICLTVGQRRSSCLCFQTVTFLPHEVGDISRLKKKKKITLLHTQSQLIQTWTFTLSPVFNLPVCWSSGISNCGA